MMKLGQSLRARRIRDGYTSTMVAEACSLTPTAMSRIELGHALPRYGVLCSLAIFYGIELSKLLADVSAKREFK